VLADRDPGGDRRHDGLERRGETDTCGRNEPDGGERQRERDHGRDKDHRRDLQIALGRRLCPRQQPRRSNDAPSNERESEAPHQERRGPVGLAESLSEREVEREDERVRGSECEAERIQLAQARVVRARGEEAAEDRERGSDPESLADGAPPKPGIDEEQDRPGVLDDERDADRDPLYRLVVDEGYPGEANHAEHGEPGQISASDA
jgi:hypothetical protein